MASRRSRPTSAAAEQLLGKRLEELLKRPSELLEGKSLAAFVPLERRADFREMLAGLPLLDRLRDWRTTLVPHAGAQVDVAMHASVLDGPVGRTRRDLWIVRPKRGL